jgi:type II secretory pathway component GspD/PulD (secretin)
MIKWFLTIIGIVLTFTAVCFASQATTSSGFSYKDKLLSCNIKNQKLEDVLGQVTKTTGVNFIFNKQKIDDTVYVEFTSLSVEKAIQKILNRFNFAVLYSRTGEVKKVLIMGKRKGSPTVGVQADSNSLPPSSVVSNQQTKTADIKNDAPEGMTLKYNSGKKYDNKVAESMTITQQPKKKDATNVVRFGIPAGNQLKGTSLSNADNRVVIENIPKQPEKDSDFPGGMSITKPNTTTGGNNAPEGMTIAPLPKTKAKTGS